MEVEDKSRSIKEIRLDKQKTNRHWLPNVYKILSQTFYMYDLILTGASINYFSLVYS